MSVQKQVDDQSLYLLLSLPLKEAVRIAAAQALDPGFMLSHQVLHRVWRSSSTIPTSLSRAHLPFSNTTGESGDAEEVCLGCI